MPSPKGVLLASKLEKLLISKLLSTSSLLPPPCLGLLAGVDVSSDVPDGCVVITLMRFPCAMVVVRTGTVDVGREVDLDPYLDPLSVGVSAVGCCAISLSEVA